MTSCAPSARGVACSQRAACAGASQARVAPAGTTRQPLPSAPAPRRAGGHGGVHVPPELAQRAGERGCAARLAPTRQPRRDLCALAALAALDAPLAASPPLPQLGITLRPYQAENVDAILTHIAGSSRVGVARFAGAARCGLLSYAPPPVRLLYVLPTGGGKTVVLVDVIMALAAAGKRTLILVHRRELVEQMVAHLRRAGLEPGVIMASMKPDPTRVVQVASIQTLNVRLAKVAAWGNFGLVAVDEAHHVMARSYQDVLQTFPSAAVIGVTATPFRHDGQGLAPVFDTLLRGPSVRTLVEQRHLVKPDIRRAKPKWTVDTSGLSRSSLTGDYNTRPLATRALRVTGDVVRNFKNAAGTRSAIVYAVNLEHSKDLTAQFVAAGYAAEHVGGNTPKPERDAIMARFRSGVTQVLCNVEIVTEGFDVPEVGAIVLVRPTLSLALYLQMVGRGLRPSAGKRDCIILDHASNTQRHGSPLADRFISLKGLKQPPGPAPASEPAKPKTKPATPVQVDDPDAVLKTVKARKPVAVLEFLLYPAEEQPELNSKERTFSLPLQPGQVMSIWAAPGCRGDTTFTCCNGRAAYLRGDVWSPMWLRDLENLLQPVDGREVAKHARNVVAKVTHGQNSYVDFTVDWAAERLLEQWGAKEAASIANDDSHPAARELRKTKPGKKVAHRLAGIVAEAAHEQVKPESGSLELLLCARAAD